MSVAMTPEEEEQRKKLLREEIARQLENREYSVAALSVAAARVFYNYDPMPDLEKRSGGMPPEFSSRIVGTEAKMAEMAKPYDTDGVKGLSPEEDARAAIDMFKNPRAGFAKMADILTAAGMPSLTADQQERFVVLMDRARANVPEGSLSSLEEAKALTVQLNRLVTAEIVGMKENKYAAVYHSEPVNVSWNDRTRAQGVETSAPGISVVGGAKPRTLDGGRFT